MILKSNQFRFTGWSWWAGRKCLARGQCLASDSQLRASQFGSGALSQWPARCRSDCILTQQKKSQGQICHQVQFCWKILFLFVKSLKKCYVGSRLVMVLGINLIFGKLFSPKFKNPQFAPFLWTVLSLQIRESCGVTIHPGTDLVKLLGNPESLVTLHLPPVKLDSFVVSESPCFCV